MFAPRLLTTIFVGAVSLTACMANSGTISPSQAEATKSPQATVTISSLQGTDQIPAPAITPTSSPTKLTICLNEPPVPLNPYMNEYDGILVLEAINDGPVDFVSFQYQAVILDAIPSLETGSVLLQDVRVQSGDKYFDPEDQSVRIYEGEDVFMPQMIVQFELLRDVKWSDGVLLTAHDSVYAYDLLKAAWIDAPESVRLNQPLAESLILQTMDYRALNDFTVEWTGVPGLVTSDYPRYFFSPMPRHLQSGLNTDWPSIGWGAYQIQEWVPGDHILAIVNPYYHRTDEGLPKIDEIKFKFVTPPGRNLQECDIVSLSVASTFPKETWEAQAKESNLAVVESPGTIGMQMIFNLDRQRDSVVQDIRVRTTISLCLDRRKIAKSIGAFAADSYIHPMHLAYQSSWTFYDQKSVGDKDLQNLPSLSLAVRDSEGMRIVGEEIASELNKCGFDISIDYIPRDEFYQPFPDGPVYGSQYDMILFPLSSLEGPACDWLLTRNIPSSTFPTGNNIGRFQNSEYDYLCEQARHSISERDSITAYKETQEIWQEYLPSLPLFWFSQFAGIKCHVSGYALDPTSDELWNVEKIKTSDDCK